MELDVEQLGTILGVWAHPDDEAYLMSGVMALAADRGQHVACVTATIGEAGETSDPHRWPRERLVEIRRDELAAALRTLGVHDHECFDLPDGGLAALDPDGEDGPVARLSATIERVRPETIITFGPDGMTGHPDHRTVSAWVDAALAGTADGGRDTRVLWATKTQDWAETFLAVNDDVFPDTPPPVADADRTLVLHLDDATLERKLQALEAHASQTTSLRDHLGRESYREWVREEAFAIADPPPR